MRRGTMLAKRAEMSIAKALKNLPMPKEKQGDRDAHYCDEERKGRQQTGGMPIARRIAALPVRLSWPSPWPRGATHSRIDIQPNVRR